MKKAFYSSPYIPEEWISAHGFDPVRIDSIQEPRKDQPLTGTFEGRCSFASEFATEAGCGDYDVVLVATTCDQMRHIPEVIESGKPVFLMTVPSTWQTPGVFKLYIQELKRLGRFLCDHGGFFPSQEILVEAMEKGEAARQNRIGLAGKASRSSGVHAVPIAITGGPLLNHSVDLIHSIETAGGIVVLDATESGEMTLPSPFDRRRFRDSPFDVLADAYFSIPDIGRRPNSQYYQFLQTELSRRDIKGLIIQRYVWCDLWHGEVQRIKEWVTIPVLDLGGGRACDARTATRIQAFMEMLRD